MEEAKRFLTFSSWCYRLSEDEENGPNWYPKMESVVMGFCRTVLSPCSELLEL